MIYLLAAIGAALLTVLAWRAFGTGRAEASRGTRAPDDDPDFLRRLGERVKRRPPDGVGEEPRG
jgi:hypothetical protein